jgi:hypothetical protein
MSGRYPTKAGAAAGATGLFTITLIRPGPDRGMMEHWAYDDRAHALDEIGWLAERVAPGTEMILRDPEGNDLFRVARTA